MNESFGVSEESRKLTSPQHNPKPQKPSQDLRTSLSAVHLMAKNIVRMVFYKESPKRILDAFRVIQLVFRTARAEPIGSILGSCCLLFRVVFVSTWSP